MATSIPFHEGYPYKAMPDSASLEATEDGGDSTPHVRFVADRTLPIQKIKQLRSSSDAYFVVPIPLYLNGVLWTLKPTLSRVGGGFALTLENLGARMIGDDSGAKPGGLGSNEPKRLRAPDVLRATIAFFDAAHNETQTVACSWNSERGAFDPIGAFATPQLQALADGGSLRIRFTFVVARAYFALDKIIDLSLPITVPPKKALVEAILRGEKPDGADWKITVSERGKTQHTFHVHKQVFARASKTFEFASTFGCTVLTGKNRLELSDDGHGCFIPGATVADWRVLIPLMYGEPAPLHGEPNRICDFGTVLRYGSFKGELLTDRLFPQWERAICQQALAIDKSSVDAAVLSSMRLLSVVWTCPYGAMPVAKRLVVGVLADANRRGMVSNENHRRHGHRVVPRTPEDAEFIANCGHWDSILQSAIKHAATVASVRKFGVNLDEEEMAEASSKCAIS